jgi:hypothetical protein
MSRRNKKGQKTENEALINIFVVSATGVPHHHKEGA